MRDQIARCLYLMARLRAATGLRVSELVRLEWRDVNMRSKTITVGDYRSRGYVRVFSATPAAWDTLMAALNIEAPFYTLVFPRPGNAGKPFAASEVSTWFSRNRVITRKEWERQWMAALRRTFEVEQAIVGARSRDCVFRN